MTYSIRVETRAGVTEVTTSGDVPEGQHEITGHDTPGGASVQVTRRGPDGRYVTHAEHHARQGE